MHHITRLTAVGPVVAILLAACEAPPLDPGAPLASMGSDPMLIVNVEDDVFDGSCDAFHCSLRDAIVVSNERPGRDVIAFAIHGPGPHTIQPLSELPWVTDPAVIDGWTEPDFAGTPIVELDGSFAGEAHGLVVSAGHSVIRGLVINRFGSEWANGIELNEYGGNVIEGNYIGTDVTGMEALGNTNAGVMVNSSDNRIGGTGDHQGNVISGNLEGVTIADPSASRNLIQGNYIGTDVTGSFALGNTVGVLVLAPRNTIGGDEPGAGNVISGNIGNGIAADLDGQGTVIRGNFIGTAATGTEPLGNGLRGVFIVTSHNLIGGAAPGAGNVLSANRGGVLLTGDVHGNRIGGNLIGLDVTGTLDLGNVRAGVLLRDGAHDNWIGGTSAGLGNAIAFNGNAGIRLLAGAGAGNAVLSNALFGNGGLGIDIGPAFVTENDPGDLDEGANHLQNFPVIAWAGTDGMVSGTLNSTPDTEFMIQFFANDEADDTGYGEGQAHVGTIHVVTDDAGNAAFEVHLGGPLPAGALLSATATDPEGNTSEFSYCVEVI